MIPYKYRCWLMHYAMQYLGSYSPVSHPSSTINMMNRLLSSQMDVYVRCSGYTLMYTNQLWGSYGYHYRMLMTSVVTCMDRKWTHQYQIVYVTTMEWVDFVVGIVQTCYNNAGLLGICTWLQFLGRLNAFCTLGIRYTLCSKRDVDWLFYISLLMLHTVMVWVVGWQPQREGYIAYCFTLPSWHNYC